MQASVWGVVFGSTLAWASFDVIRKRLVRDVAVAPLSLWISLAQVPFYALWAGVTGAGLPSPGYLGPALLSVALNLVANLLFLSAMRLIPLSLGIPLLSFTPVFVAVSSVPLLGERLAWVQWLGVLLVTLGAFGLTAFAGERSSRGPLLRSLAQQRGALSMIGVAALWALAPIFDKLALRHASVPAHGLVLALGVSAGMGVVLAVRGELRELGLRRSSWLWLTAGGGINVVALGLQMIAISTLVVSLFEAFKRALGLLLSLVFGLLFFGERLTTAKLAAGFLMALGVALVLL